MWPLPQTKQNISITPKGPFMSLLNQYFTPKPFWFKPLSGTFACSWNSCKWIYIVYIFRERDLLSSTYHTVLKSMHVFVYVSIQPMGSVVIESVVSSQVSKKKQNYHASSAFLGLRDRAPSLIMCPPRKADTKSSFFKLLNSILLYDYTTICLSILLSP